MSEHHSRVTLVTDMDMLVQELDPQPLWLVRPQMPRKYASQRVGVTAELTDLASINLAKLKTFETV